MSEANMSDSDIVNHCVQARGGWLWEITERRDGSKVEKRLEPTDKEDGWCQRGWYVFSKAPVSAVPDTRPRIRAGKSSYG